MHGELAGVAAGIRTDLALERSLIVVDSQMFLQTAAVCCCIGTVFALVRLLARVRAAVHVEFVPSAETLMAKLTFKWLLTWAVDRKTISVNLSFSITLQQSTIKN